MKIAKLFKNGQSQAVRLPKEFRLSGTQVYIKRFGRGIVILPMDEFWFPFWDAAGEFTSDFMSERDQGKFDREPKL